ncbi:MAG: sensor histidine kinase [Spirochaetes bacterium]|nr:sensor histidine kinase [Spirochaetota bacterium]
MRSKLLFSFVLVILLPVLTLGILGPYISARTIENETTSHTVQLIRQVTRNIESTVRNTESIISIVDANPDVQAFMAFRGSALPFSPQAQAATRQLLRSISDAHPEIAGILIVSADNRSLSNEIQPITRDPLTEESWYRKAIDNQGTVQLLPRPIGRNLRSIHEYSADEVVSIVKAVVDPGSHQVQGVVLIDMRLKIMEEILGDMTVGLGGFLFIVAPGGAIVYTPVNPIVYRVRDEWLDTPRTSVVRRIKGAYYQIVSQGSDYTQWKTVGVFPLNEIMSQVSTIRYYSVIIAVITVLVALIVAVFFSNGIARPVIELRSLMKEAEEGNLAVRFDGRQEDEIGHLGKSFNAMIEEVQKLIALVYREQQSKREAELRTLQEQIKPHFLYNTLDTIQWMAQEHGAQDIVQIVGALTSLFRIALSRGKEMIPITDEMEHVRSYLIIQKARYEDKFDFTLSTDEEALSCMVLKLTVQPLVENAIYHGIKERRGHGSIQVEALRRDGMLVLRVSDDGVGMTPAKLEEVRALLTVAHPHGEGLEGYGIHNVHERIRLSFGTQYGLRFDSAPGRGTTVEILHPLVMSQELSASPKGSRLPPEG